MIKAYCQQEQDDYDGDGGYMKITQMIFNAWDFSVDEKIESIALRQATKIVIDAELNVDNIKK